MVSSIEKKIKLRIGYCVLLYVAQMLAGMFNVVVMNTLLVVLAVFALSLLISRVVLTKIM